MRSLMTRQLLVIAAALGTSCAIHAQAASQDLSASLFDLTGLDDGTPVLRAPAARASADSKAAATVLARSGSQRQTVRPHSGPPEEREVLFTAGAIATEEGRLYWKTVRGPRLEGSGEGREATYEMDLCFTDEDGVPIYRAYGGDSRLIGECESSATRRGTHGPATRADEEARRIAHHRRLVEGALREFENVEFASAFGQEGAYIGTELKMLVDYRPEPPPLGPPPQQRNKAIGLEAVASQGFAPCVYYSYFDERDCDKLGIEVWTGPAFFSGGWVEDWEYSYLLAEHSATRGVHFEYNGTDWETLVKFSTYNHGRIAGPPLSRDGTKWTGWIDDQEDLSYLAMHCPPDYAGNHDSVADFGYGIDSGDILAGTHNCNDDTYVQLTKIFFNGFPSIAHCTDDFGRPWAPDYNLGSFRQCSGCECSLAVP